MLGTGVFSLYTQTNSATNRPINPERIHRNGCASNMRVRASELELVSISVPPSLSGINKFPCAGSWASSSRPLWTTSITASLPCFACNSADFPDLVSWAAAGPGEVDRRRWSMYSCLYVSVAVASAELCGQGDGARGYPHFFRFAAFSSECSALHRDWASAL